MSHTPVSVTVETIVHVPVSHAWEYWNNPSHVIHWNFANEDWHCPHAESDFRIDGKFNHTMAAKDGSFSFEFWGIYQEIVENALVTYVLGDDRKVRIEFIPKGDSTQIIETFEAESQNPIEMQQMGWQAILNNFKKYAEGINDKDTLHYEILIPKSPQFVYEMMLSDSGYRQWTAAFNETSHFKGSWEDGSKMLFLGCDAEGNLAGMVSTIKTNKPNKFISIEHIGEFKDGKEIVSGPDVEQWAGSLENYTYNEDPQGTLLKIDMIGKFGDFTDYFNDTWPKALQKLKEICEN